MDGFAKRIEEASGKVIVPRTAIPGVGWIVYWQDTEGNVFSIMEDDSRAA